MFHIVWYNNIRCEYVAVSKAIIINSYDDSKLYYYYVVINPLDWRIYTQMNSIDGSTFVTSITTRIHMTQINAYLIFNGNCREAMTFYKECLGGQLTMESVEESPMADQWPAEVQKHILHASLIRGNLALWGSDMASPEPLIRGNNISLAIECSTEEEISSFFSNLSQGGRITHPLHKFYDGTIGALRDKFGLNWLFKL